MKQQERQVWLLQYLIRENRAVQTLTIPKSSQEQKNLIRALMNVRMPNPISEEFLHIQDTYLQEENAKFGYVEMEDLKPSQKHPQMYIWQGDITRLKVDGIVNAANSQLLGCFQPLHNCIDNMIHSKAGVQLRLKMNEIMEEQGHEEPTGHAKITPSYNLPCEYVIHTVGPIVSGPLTKKHEELLASCYRSCLNIAAENGVKSIAFCCISTGVFMFPNERAAEIAVDTVKAWLAETGSQMKVVFNVYKDLDLEIYSELLQ